MIAQAATSQLCHRVRQEAVLIRYVDVRGRNVPVEVFVSCSGKRWLITLRHDGKTLSTEANDGHRTGDTHWEL